VYLVSLKRQALPLPIMPNTVVRRATWWSWPAGPARWNAWRLRWLSRIAGGKSDLAYHALAIVVGTLLGLISVRVGGIPVTLGVGGGVLVSGLCFGWITRAIRSSRDGRRPRNGFSPSSVLSAFAAVIGLSAGSKAVAAIQEHGVALLIAGAVVTIIRWVALYFGGSC